MRRKKSIIIAICFSLTAHGVFFAVSPHIIFSGMREIMDETCRIFRLKDVKKETAFVALFKKEEERIVPAIKMSRRISLSGDENIERMVLEEKREKDASLRNKKRKMFEGTFEEAFVSGGEKTADEAALKIEEEKAKKEAAPAKRLITQNSLKEGHLFPPVTSSEGIRKLRYISQEEGFNGVQKEWSGWNPADNADIFRMIEKDFSASSGGKTREWEYEDISRYLDVELTRYEDADTKEKYFKLVIYVKDGDKLEILPKEITFLVDSSKSITEGTLSCIKDGIIRALKDHNKGDSFNLIAFRDNFIRFKQESVIISKETIKEAAGFMKKLLTKDRTNVEQALLDIIKEPVITRPSYIMLISDGRPTAGIVDSREIIKEITRCNKRERSVFCYGTGLKVNRYLLDFISYQNRAWCVFADASRDSGKSFNKFCSEIKSPILLNVRYRVKGLDADEIYPKYLSDFYQGKPFVLYGRFKDEDIFFMQLLGRIDNKIKEFIFKQSLSAAKPGGEDIAREWAFRKIYYLISLHTMNMADSNALSDEIKKLSTKYKITTPYNIESSK